MRLAQINAPAPFVALLARKLGAHRGYRGPARPFTRLTDDELLRARRMYSIWLERQRPATAPAPVPTKARRSRSKTKAAA